MYRCPICRAQFNDPDYLIEETGVVTDDGYREKFGYAMCPYCRAVADGEDGFYDFEEVSE